MTRHIDRHREGAKLMDWSWFKGYTPKRLVIDLFETGMWAFTILWAIAVCTEILGMELTG